MKLKQKFFLKRKFAYKPVTEEFVKSIVNNLRIKQTCKNKAAVGDIPLLLIKGITFILPYCARCVSEALVKCEFSDSFKLSRIALAQKEEDPTENKL